VGAVSLAVVDADLRRRLVGVRPLPAYTSRTITEPAGYLEELERVGREGHAVDDEEYLAGVRAVSAPVRDHSGAVVAALTVVAAAPRLPSDELPAVAREVRSAARQVSERLGEASRPDDGPGGDDTSATTTGAPAV